MEYLYYERPSIERKKDAIDYINEFIINNSKIHGSGGMDKYLDNYEQWLLKIEEYKSIEPSDKLVPAETFFLVRESDQRIVGMVNIRLVLNERLKHSGGHIGYSIRPTERRKGYNKINLYLALKVLQEHNVEEAILSCDKDNPASSRTMLALGAKLVDEFIEDGIVEQKYAIDVNKSLEKYKDFYDTQLKRNR